VAPRGMDGVTSSEPPSQVVICLLGGFQVLKFGDPVTVRPGGKTELLLSRLALQEHNRASREWLLEVIWPESDLARASHALNSLVHATRKLLGDALGGESPVVSTGGSYALNTGAGISIDIAEFDALATQAESRFRAGDADRALPDSLAALTLYRGDLCMVDGVRGLVESERLRALHLSLLGQVADEYFRCENYRMALRYALRLLANDPCREDAHRLVMRCHVRLGERAQAFRQYKTCERTLAEEFGVRPEPLTVSLFEQVRTAPGAI
jgi:DNA-binding SARP family transcriptional activator